MTIAEWISESILMATVGLGAWGLYVEYRKPRRTPGLVWLMWIAIGFVISTIVIIAQ